MDQEREEMMYQFFPNGQIAKFPKSKEAEWKSLLESYKNGTLPKDHPLTEVFERLLKSI